MARHYNPADFGANAIWPALGGAVRLPCRRPDGAQRNLGAALAFHLATNFSGMVLVGLYGSLDGLALHAGHQPARWRRAGALSWRDLSMLVSWLIARLVLRL
ncbi:MAG: hypothetical protein R3D78_06815 [Paracoccaceae bacterium]